MEWCTPTGPTATLQRYAFTYDGLSRLTRGSYSQPATGGLGGAYDEALAYDLNGNITALSRWAPQNNAAGLVDQLAYTYTGNQLTAVTDNAGAHAAQGYVDGYTAAVDRTYDALGRMATDRDRGVAVAYNALSLPEKVSSLADPNDKIAYIYDAAGRKLAVRSGGKATIYAGSAVIDSATAGAQLAFLLNGEGRLVPDGAGGYRAEYFLKDHLGNVRAVVARNGSGNKELVSASSYYPFGLEMAAQAYQSGTPNPYRYNGKELQAFLQVAGRSLGWYDYGVRFYEPEIGRWTTVDPVAEWHFNQDPYSYCLNNPLRFVVRYGMDTTIALQPVYCIAPKPAPKTPKPQSLLARVVNKIGNAMANLTHGIFGPSDAALPRQLGSMQNYGDQIFGPNGQGTPDKAKVTGVMGELPSLEFDPLDFAAIVAEKIFGKTTESQQKQEELGPVFTSDKDIKESTTGDNTGNGGKPIVDDLYKGWKKDTIHYEDAYISPDGDSTLLIGPTGDSVMIVQMPGRNYSYQGEKKHKK